MPSHRCVHMLVWNDFRHDARVLKEAQTLQATGYQVVVHAVHAPGKTRRRELLLDRIEVCRSGNLPVRRNLPTKVFSRLWWHWVVFCRLLVGRPSVIHAHDINTLPTAWAAAKLTGAPLVYDAHEISASREGYARVRGVVAWLERKLMPCAVGIITTTVSRAKFFARVYGIERPLVLQNRPRQQSPLVSNRIREELGLVQPWPIVVYQGGLQQGRGLEQLVRVAAMVPDAYFVFIGGGLLDASLRSIAAELGLEDRVRFIPTVALAELPSYTASADIGVQPIENTCLNHYTTDSNKLFEYVQAGLPVVASDLPEIRRVVRANDLGLLVPEGDTEALAAALRSLVEDKAMREFYAGRSRTAAAVLNWEAQEGDLVALYERVLGGKSRLTQ